MPTIVEFTCKQCGCTFESVPRNMKKHNKENLCDICYESNNQKNKGAMLKWIYTKN